VRTAHKPEPSCQSCNRLSECPSVDLQMLVNLDSCAVFENAHLSVIKARADMTDLIGPWVLLRGPFPKRREGEYMSRKPQTVRGALGEIGRKLGVLDTRKAFQMPAKAMAEALQSHVAEFNIDLEEVVAQNDLDALLEILEQIGDDGGEPVGKVEKKVEAPAARRGRPAAKAEEEEEETPAPRRRGKPVVEEEEEAPAPRRGRRPAAEEKAPVEEEEPEEVPRRGRRGKPAEEEVAEEPAARRGRRGKAEEVAEEPAEEETAPAGRGRRGKPAETGTGDGGAAVAALIADLRKQVDGNSEAIQSLGKLNVEIDRILTQTDTLGQAIAFIANDYFQLGKKDKIGNVLSLDESLESYINGGN